VFREWAPNANAIYLLGDFCGWQADSVYALSRVETTVSGRLHVPDDVVAPQAIFFACTFNGSGGQGERIPAYARRVVQDPGTLIFNAQVWVPPEPYQWRHTRHTSVRTGRR
jgi:1,4-alpha-glucan branching enzyme